MFMVCMPPRAARLSPAAGPAVANGDTSSASPHHSSLGDAPFGVAQVMDGFG